MEEERACQEAICVSQSNDELTSSEYQNGLDQNDFQIVHNNWQIKLNGPRVMTPIFGFSDSFGLLYEIRQDTSFKHPYNNPFSVRRKWPL